MRTIIIELGVKMRIVMMVNKMIGLGMKMRTMIIVLVMRTTWMKLCIK